MGRGGKTNNVFLFCIYEMLMLVKNLIYREFTQSVFVCKLHITNYKYTQIHTCTGEDEEALNL